MRAVCRRFGACWRSGRRTQRRLSLRARERSAAGCSSGQAASPSARRAAAEHAEYAAKQLAETADLQRQLRADADAGASRLAAARAQLGAPPNPSVNTFLQFATRPEWCVRMLTAKRWNMGNIVGHATGVDDLGSLSSWTSQQFDPRLSWADVAWVKERWGDRKLIFKGIMDVDDARA
ncbi:MAG: alpha-hydroxy-acid oxidizing protein, partial [Pseudomonadota bacterium]|nr:alpha-hydroxy-acid oxidizing protein [Pseudomonadota bacterium]